MAVRIGAGQALHAQYRGLHLHAAVIPGFISVSAPFSIHGPFAGRAGRTVKQAPAGRWLARGRDSRRPYPDATGEAPSMDIAGKHFLITGGVSLIGSHLADRLLAHGAARIVLFDNLSLNAAEIVGHLSGDPRV